MAGALKPIPKQLCFVFFLKLLLNNQVYGSPMANFYVKQ